MAADRLPPKKAKNTRTLMVLLTLTMLLVACNPAEGTIQPTGTKPAVTTPIPPTTTSNPTRTLTPTPTPPPETCFLKPKEEVLVSGMVIDPLKYSSINRPPDNWSVDEQKNNGVFAEVKLIMEKPWVTENQLRYVETALGNGCGYAMLFEGTDENANRYYAWATDKDNKLLGSPEGAGAGVGIQKIEVLNIPGRATVLVGKKDRELVWVQEMNGKEVVVRRYDQIKREWVKVAGIDEVTPTVQPINILYDLSPKVDIKKVPRVSEADFNSGKVTQWEMKLMEEGKIKPFSGKAKPYGPGIIYYCDHGDSLHDVCFMGLGPDYPTQPELRPTKIASLFTLEIKGKILIVMGVPYKNVDGSITFMHYAFQNYTDPLVIEEIEKFISGEYRVQPFAKIENLPYFLTSGRNRYDKETVLLEQYRNNPDTRSLLLKKWVETGIVPTELSQLLLLGVFTSW